MLREKLRRAGRDNGTKDLTSDPPLPIGIQTRLSFPPIAYIDEIAKANQSNIFGFPMEYMSRTADTEAYDCGERSAARDRYQSILLEWPEDGVSKRLP
jgi:hypothetical protein